MRHSIKFIFVNAFLLISIQNSFSQLKHTIELSLEGNTLTLHDPGTLQVHRRDTVEWRIKTSERISSFNIAGASHPFSRNLPNQDGEYFSITRVVNRGGTYDWKYKIFYRITSVPGRRFLDPKIAIRPTFHYDIILIGAGIILGLLAFWPLRMLFKKFTKKT